MSKPSFVDVDLKKTWESVLLATCLVPVTFATQSYLVYLTLPTFFGTSFKSGFTWQPLQLTALIWAVSTAYISLLILILMLRRRIIRRLLSPEAGDRMELKYKQKEHQQVLNIFLLQPGSKKTQTTISTFVKTTPFNLLKMFVVLYIAAQIMPDMFATKSFLNISVYAACYVAFEILTSCLKTVFCFGDLRRVQSATTSDTTDPPTPKSNIIGRALNELQEERAIEVTRLDMAIDYAPNSSAYIARGKANRGNRELILALEDFDKALSLDSESIEAYTERAQTYLELDLKTLATIDLSHAAQLCASTDKLSDRDKIFANLRDLSAKSNPHRTKSFKEAMSAISPLFTSDISPLQDKILKDVEVDLQGNVVTAPVYCRQAELLFQKKQYEDASQACDKAIELQSDIGQAYKIKGKIALTHKRDKSAALAYFDKAIASDSKDSEVWEDRARLKVQLEQYQSALDDCSEAMLFSKSSQFKIIRALALLGLNRTDEALNDLNLFVTSTERAISIWNSLRLPLCRQVGNELAEILIPVLELRGLLHEQMQHMDKAASDVIAAQRLRERKRPPVLKSKPQDKRTAC